MIISRTPVRISFVGGGTDLPAFYQQEGGAVITTAINKYIYVTVNKRFDETIRVSYSITEIVDDVDQLRHGLIREAMKLTGVTQGVELTTIADVPGTGTGLGSSSALTVGVLNALYAYRGIAASPARLAQEACRIELDLLHAPIGKQDQYIAAYGGINHLAFRPDGDVWVDPVIMPGDRREALQQRLMLFFTGVTRHASSIMAEQQQGIQANRGTLSDMKHLVSELRECLSGDGPLDRVGELLHEGWMLKQRLATAISSNGVGRMYARARDAGCVGGKITGAGGGGFLLLYCPKDRQHRVREVVADLREMEFRLEPQGTKIIYVGE
ncbi:MAG: GHMP kinase [Candidatus Omnitrophica bacterium]|nr:GHMP kinase [Candidatus Omnitrophota bacterium]